MTYGLLTLIALSVIVFTLLQMAGGGPLNRLQANPRNQSDRIQQLTEFYGLDRPVHEQYVVWAWKYAQGDWGVSFESTRPVSSLIGERVLATLRLTATAMIITVVIGVAFGVYQALRQYSVFDHAGTTAWFVTASVPDFILAIGLQVVLAVYLTRWTGVRFFYAAGMNSAEYGSLSAWARLGDTAQHLALPALTLGILGVATYARFQRASMLEVLHSDYLRTARAKGLPRRRVIVKHALRNALLPMVTLLSLHVASLIGGALLIEVVFGWPGLGRLYVDGVQSLNYSVVMAVVMIGGIATIVMNIVADVAYGLLDPRVRLE